MKIREEYTCTELLNHMVSIAKPETDSRIERDASSKGALFCPNCGHQSQYDGDWNVVKNG